MALVLVVVFISYGIYNSDSAKIGNITNIGIISGTGAGTSSAGYGLWNI
ncbi:MAG: hypothetical protein OGM09_08630 [Fusobacterium varium]|nr:hypothetical protein [Fusobacterium varium]UYI77242.1 MAG: hypothetical protein OGM09_08630 [Fusobacterium varium]